MFPSKRSNIQVKKLPSIVGAKRMKFSSTRRFYISSGNRRASDEIFSSSTRTLTVQVGDAGGDEDAAVRAKLDAGGAGRGGSLVVCGAGEAAPAEGLATGGGHGGGGGDGFRFYSFSPLGSWALSAADGRVGEVAISFAD
jgi:hypothetical protein